MDRTRVKAARGAIWPATAICWAMCVVASASLTGCSGSAQGSAELAVTPVSGRVSYRGKPLEDAFVRLHPIAADSSESSLPLPRARSKSDGTFQFSTYRTGDGAPPGKYQVAFSWAGSLQGLTEEQRDRRPEKLPLKYTRPETSGIVVEISETETTLPAIELN